MADPKEDKIDFTKLEKELYAAVEADASYWRENDAKIRAMEQRVETYDQFRDMVAAAHIRPLDKKDKIGQGKRHQPWNPFSSSSNSTSPSQNPQEAQNGMRTSSAMVKVPKNGHEFMKEWRTRKKSDSCYSYLIDLGGDTLAKIFRSEISFGLLGEIITTLNNQAEEKHCGNVVDILLCLTQAGRFGLSLDFLSKCEKEALTEMVEKLEQWRPIVDSSQQDDVKVEGTETEDSGKERLDGVEQVENGHIESGKQTQQGCILVLEEDIMKLKELYKLSQK